MVSSLTLAPELHVSAWLNTRVPLSLAALRGKVVVLYAFQMLCPGCVSHGIPQVTSIRANFKENDVAVIGLHTVFEHHDVMNQRALEVFLHEYRIQFPVAIDTPSALGPVPLTMERYELRGTPSLLLIDQHGTLRYSWFGRAEDLLVGAAIGQLLAEGSSAERVAVEDGKTDAGCDESGCRIG